MISRIRSSRLTLAIAAAFALLAGSATAAKLITGRDVRNGSLTGADLKDRSIGLKDLSRATVARLSGGRDAGGANGA